MGVLVVGAALNNGTLILGKFSIVTTRFGVFCVKTVFSTNAEFFNVIDYRVTKSALIFTQMYPKNSQV